MDLKSLLNDAIERKNSEDDVEQILSRYVDKDELNKDSSDGLFVAAAAEKLAIVKVLIAAGANVNAKERKGGLTPLHVAIKQHDQATARLLLEQGAKVNEATKHNSTALHMAVESGDAELVRLVLEHGGNVDAKKFGRSPLHLAVEKGNAQMAELLLSRGCSVNAACMDGGTALHMAVEARDVRMVRLLLAHGAKTSIRKFGNSPLFLAVRNGCRETARALLGNGRDEDCGDEEHERDKVGAAELAIRAGDKSMLHCLLECGRLQVNLRVSERCLLHRAIEAGWQDTLQLLLCQGASPAALTAQGTTALQLALRQRNHEAARLLLQRLSAEEVNAPEQPGGQSALHLAVASGSLEMARLLLQRGADVEARSARGVSALQLAFQAQRLDLVELLMAHGAQPSQAAACYGKRPLEVAIECRWLELGRRLLASAAAEANGEGFDGASMLSHAVRSRDVRLVRLLLEAGADVTVAGRGPRHRPLLFQAVDLRCEAALLEALLEHGATADARDPESGLSALQLAVSLGAEDAARLLVARGARLDYALADGSTALLLGLDKCDQKLVELLLRHGADVKMRRPGCPSPLQRAISLDWRPLVQLMLDRGAAAGEDAAALAEPLCYAVSKGDAGMFEQLLALGADPLAEVESGGRTLLHVAATCHCPAIVEELLTRGLRVNALDRKSPEGLSPLHVALLAGNEETALLLLDRGASVRMRERFSNRTPLHLAAETGCARVAHRLLVQKAVPVDERATHGVTPLQVAAMSGQPAIAELLIRYGARVDLISGSEHYSPLHCAICHRGYEVAEVLLAAGALAFGCQCHRELAPERSPFGYARRNINCERIQQLLLQYEPASMRRFVREEMMVHLASYTLEAVSPLAAIYLKHMARRGPPLTSLERRRLTPSLLQFYEQCLEELTRIRQHRFYEEISFGSLLDRDIRSLGGLVRNDSLVHAFEDSGYRETYPLYEAILADCLARARTLELLYVDAEHLLNRLFDLPIEIGRQILKLLHVTDLRNFNNVLPQAPAPPLPDP